MSMWPLTGRGACAMWKRRGPSSAGAIATILLFAVGGCRGLSRDESNPEQRPWLVVVPAATDLKTLDNGSVRYSVSMPYPGNEVIAQIGNELQLRGWQPVDEDLVLSGVKNSHAEGWRTLLDRDGNFLYQWQADWTDEAKNGATYRLLYRYPAAAGGRFTPNDSLEVEARFWPAAVIEKQRSIQR